ncbi:hypothetical protein G7046_g6242 [Stylonectria norvegica]|nr:hypothetical protein G7046_g6242 [Stylonectria norvegica]
MPDGRKTPGHGAARVQVSFWFFLFVYYGCYNLTALIWITKVFNLYSLNWWPQSLGFPLTVSLIAILSLALPVPVYLNPSTRFLTIHNTAWISWTFVIMALPVAIAFLILTTNERHVGLRHSLSETQRIFTTSWWTGEPDTLPRRDRTRRNFTDDTFEADILQNAGEQRPQGVGMRRRWLPASFVRFLWFCVALFVGLMAYVIGEAYAEIYLRTLPHDNLETVAYVYGWVVTVHLLDALTGWVLGIREGERVGSYPLSWVFKLYFMVTYQTYVRALYARLRSPAQFVILQVLSSTGLVIITPIMMTPIVHKILTLLGLNYQSYESYQKLQTRNIFIRFLAENVSMVAFLGSILVLHFGANQDVYPYFAFDDDREPYDFNLTFYASMVTWACELVASVAIYGERTRSELSRGLHSYSDQQLSTIHVAWQSTYALVIAGRQCFESSRRHIISSSILAGMASFMGIAVPRHRSPRLEALDRTGRATGATRPPNLRLMHAAAKGRRRVGQTAVKLGLPAAR